MISNTAQVNMFTGGMNMDTDVTMIPKEQYRYAENIRLVTNDGGTTGVLLNVEGVRQYASSIPTDERIVGTTTIHDMAVVITVRELGNSWITKVYKITGFNTNQPNVDIVVAAELGMNDSTTNVSIVGNYETDSNIKVYFTDGNSAIKVVDITEDGINKYRELSSNGILNNSKALDITPGATLPPFELTGLGIGNLPTGVVLYCYLLFNMHGAESALSSLSSKIHLTSSTTNQGSQEYEGSFPGTSSGKSCTMKSPLITKDFDKCRIISIRYTSNNSTPLIVIVDEIDVTPDDQYIMYTDSGNAYMGEITVDEFNNLTGYQFTAKSITKMQNRLFAANITEDTWDVGGYDARVYRFNSNGSAVLGSSNLLENITITASQMNSVDPRHDCINPYNSVEYSSGSNRYIYKSDGITLGGSGVNIDYNFVTFPVKLGNHTDDCSMNVSTEVITDIISGQTNVVTIDGVQIELDQDTYSRTPNYADPFIASRFTGYQRDEVYRFGIIFYNDKGIPSTVNWIGDIKMPHAELMPPFSNVDGVLYGNALGIHFTVKTVPDGAVAYEIVRCDRTESDRTVLMLCALSNVYEYMISETSDRVGHGENIEGSIEMRPSFFLSYYYGNIKTDISGIVTPDGVVGTDELTTMFYSDVPSTSMPDSLYILNYARLISPEICVMKQDSEQYFKDAVYLLLIGKYGCTVTRNTGVGISPFSFPTRIKQYSGNIIGVPNEKNYLSTENGTIIYYFQTDADIIDTGLIGPIDYNIIGTYHGNISKFFNPVYDSNDNSVTVKSAKYPIDIPYNQYHDIKPSTVNIGEMTYTNYAMSCFNRNNMLSTTGPAGPCMVVETDGLLNIPRYTNTSYNDAFSIPVFNLKRNVASAYNGNTFTSRQNSIYIPVSQYTKINISTRYDSIIYGGDVYLNVLDYPCQFTFQANDEKQDMYRRRYIGAYIPFESSINMNLFNGDMPHRTYSNGYLDTHIQLEPTLKGVYHVQDRPYYVYNTVYSTLNGSKIYVPKSIYSEDNLSINNRIYTSEPKINNEVTDSWTTFKVANYLDVDNQYGGITNIKTFKDRLFYWQPSAFGIAAVNERSLITDDNINQLVLGTGGVLSRFDYITTTNGSSIINDRSIVNSDNILYWYDFDKNELCAYTGGVAALSKEKQVQTYLNEMYSNKRNCSMSMFDKKYNEVWFKFYNKSLIYNELVSRFTSFYTFSPDWSLLFSDKTVAIKDNNLYVLNTIDTDGLGVIDKLAKLTFVVNDNVQYSKVFDNIGLLGEFKDLNGAQLTTGIVENLKFETKNQIATINDVTFDYREDTFRLPIPRQDEHDDPMSFPARMRGKYMICSYEFNSNNEHTFEIPLITTTYRYSLI